jgi:hypothetical protein
MLFFASSHWHLQQINQYVNPTEYRHLATTLLEHLLSLSLSRLPLKKNAAKVRTASFDFRHCLK